VEQIRPILGLIWSTLLCHPQHLSLRKDLIMIIGRFVYIFAIHFESALVSNLSKKSGEN